MIAVKLHIKLCMRQKIVMGEEQTVTETEVKLEGTTTLAKTVLC